jgi:hypothetical protein
MVLGIRIRTFCHLLLWACLTGAAPAQPQAGSQPDGTPTMQSFADFSEPLEEIAQWMPGIWVATYAEKGQRRWLVEDGLFPVTLRVDGLGQGSTWLGLTDLRQPGAVLSFGGPERARIAVAPGYSAQSVALSQTWSFPRRPRTELSYSSGGYGFHELLLQHAQPLGKGLSVWLEGGSNGYDGYEVGAKSRGYLFQARARYQFSPAFQLKVASRKAMEEESLPHPIGREPWLPRLLDHEKLTVSAHRLDLLWERGSGRSLSTAAEYRRESWETRPRPVVTGYPAELTELRWLARAQQGSWDLAALLCRLSLDRPAEPDETWSELRIAAERSIALGAEAGAQLRAGCAGVSPRRVAPVGGLELAAPLGPIISRLTVEHEAFLPSALARSRARTKVDAFFATRTAAALLGQGRIGRWLLDLRLAHVDARNLLLPQRSGEGSVAWLRTNHVTESVSFGLHTEGSRLGFRLKGDHFSSPVAGYPSAVVLVEVSYRDTLFSGDLPIRLATQLQAWDWKTGAMPLDDFGFVNYGQKPAPYCSASLRLDVRFRDALFYAEAQYAPPGHREIMPGLDSEPAWARWGLRLVLWD